MVKGDQKPAAIATAKGDSVKEDNSVDAIAEPQESDSGAEPSKSSTVQELIAKVKNDSQLSDSSKLDTLALLVMTFVNENSGLENEIKMINEQAKKHVEAKDAIKALNEFLKKQISLVKEESELRLQEEKSKREESVGGYQNTMSELSGLLEKKEGDTSSLKVQNGELADQMILLVKDTGKREEQIEKMQMEFQLQVKLLEHQVAKAQIEKAEVKADMTKDRLETMQDLAAERDRGFQMGESVKLLKQQADLYQEQMVGLQNDGVDNSKSFQFFKIQIDKITTQMVQLEHDTIAWKEKSEMSTNQVKKMSESTKDNEKELTNLRKKLDSMVKLNKTLNSERVKLLEKVKNQV
eukprot:GFUD01019129.1.p1 GENE.GFUD01019129.1~~GFUD01019129.1.p1  ORF type:complete len:352 (+),score=130.61 GFUD01019129.1:54-1109(+)